MRCGKVFEFLNRLLQDSNYLKQPLQSPVTKWPWCIETNCISKIYKMSSINHEHRILQHQVKRGLESSWNVVSAPAPRSTDFFIKTRPVVCQSLSRMKGKPLEVLEKGNNNHNLPASMQLPLPVYNAAATVHQKRWLINRTAFLL